MPERPLLILPTPTEPAKRSKKTGGGGRPHLPTRDRQAERLTPRFTVLQETLDARRARLRTESSGVIPEEVIVLETVGPIDNFIVAVRNIEGLEWLGEVEEEDMMASQKTTKSIIVRNINGELHRLLKETAQRRHRSVSSLILCLIEDWAKNREEGKNDEKA